MRTRALLVLAAGCSASARPPAPRALAAHDAGTTLAVPDAAAPVSAGVDASVPEEAPLAWGTRPPRTGPLYPVIDGECLGMTVWPLDDGNALVSYGDRGGSTTSIGHFTDDGVEDVGQTKQAAAFLEFSPSWIGGAWPEPLMAFSEDRGGTRARTYETIWAHRADGGWVSIASWRDDDSPILSSSGIFRGNAIIQRHSTTWGGAGAGRDGAYYAIPLTKDAARIEDIASLRRADTTFSSANIGADEIYAIGQSDRPGTAEPGPSSLRIWREGKVREIKLGPAGHAILSTKPQVVITFGNGELRVLGDGDKLEAIPSEAGPNESIASRTTAPDGSVWVRLVPKVWSQVESPLRIARRDPSGKVEEIPPPSDAGKPYRTSGTYGWPGNVVRLVGVEQGDPWALSVNGTLSHWVGGSWVIVELPSPYRAASLALPAKGDLYVLAGNGPKGRAVLRTKRPKEVLRCNEGAGGFGYTNGRGYMSFPPPATAECKTPFAILLRTAYSTSVRPKVMFDAKTDFPSVREAIKGTPGAGDSVALVEIAAGEQRYLGLAVPSLEVGNAIAAAVAKKVKTTPAISPEIVCGQPPKIVRTIKVDVATGKTLP